jgi:carboxyl-terminal processing protease
MQDYKRAVVVGSTSFGKGTVQRIISLDDIARYLGLKTPDNKGIGSIKITVQKFYRINGGSTQLKGVTPDIILPDPYQDIDMGERRDKASLKWDEIPAVAFQTVANPVPVAQLKALSQARVSNNSTFNLIKSNAQLLKDKEKNRYYSLNEVKYKKEMDEAAALSKKMEELEKKAVSLSVVNPKEDLASINMDSTTIARNVEWLKNVKKDIYISETVSIIKDMNKAIPKLNNSTGMK